LWFGQALALHQQSLGAVDHLAVLQFGPCVGELASQFLFVLEPRQRHVQDRVDAFWRQPGDDVGRYAGGQRIAHMAGVVVVGEHHDRAAMVAGGHHNVFQRIARGALGIHHDHVGLELGDALAQEGVGGQHGDHVVTVFQQGDAQQARALRLLDLMLIRDVGRERIWCDHDDAKQV
jgi:hypothetical protein